jgi:hypothetical protein
MNKTLLILHITVNVWSLFKMQKRRKLKKNRKKKNRMKNRKNKQRNKKKMKMTNFNFEELLF